MSKENEMNENPEEEITDQVIPQEEDEEEVEGYGVISRIIGVFTEPSKAFKHIAEKPEIWGPIILSLLVLILFTFLTLNAMVPMSEKATAELLTKLNVPQDLIDQQVAKVESSSKYGFINPVILMLLFWVITAGIVQLVSLLLGHEGGYKSTIAVIAYSTLPAVLFKTGILATLITLMGDWGGLQDYMITIMKIPSLYGLTGAPDLQVNLKVLLSQIDPFLIWGTFLMSIGFMHANKVSRANAWKLAVVASIIWVAVNNPLPAFYLKLFTS
jgi:hypothetical protein